MRGARASNARIFAIFSAFPAGFCIPEIPLNIQEDLKLTRAMFRSHAGGGEISTRFQRLDAA
jgi:hypothetical protein